ncbi:MAG: EAL domain-containing protein [Gammaproteobacteria bacterium]|nr:EAL domain-containing protein [Gammaproteobacteria bacterium]
MGRSTAGLRARLLLLVLFAVIPAFGVIGYTAIAQRQHATQDAEKEAVNLMRLAAREQGRLIELTRQLLIGMSQMPALRQPAYGSPRCSETLRQLQKSYPYYTNLGVADLNGDLMCTSRKLARKINIADRSYFRRTVQSREFGIGDYQIGRVTGQPAINFGYPIVDTNGNVVDIVYAALDLNWLQQLVAGVELPAGSAMVVVDSNGTVLTRYPDAERWMGKSMVDAPLVKAILTQQRAGVTLLDGLDGVPRLQMFAPLYESGLDKVYICIGIPPAVAYARADEDFSRSLVLLFVVGVLAIVAAWVGSDVFILRRVYALTDAARRLAKGDLSARSGLPHGTEELGQLARTFDDMATALQRVNRALKTLSEGNRTVVRATDERALLAEMCRIIVKVGGYRFAWIGLAEHDSRKTVRLMAEFGFEGGSKALSEAIGRVSWADDERGRGPAGMVIRTGEPYIGRNILTDPNYAPWRELALRVGYGSCVAFPLNVDDEPIGALSIYSSEPDAFDAEELELLEEAARDLAFGMSVLRARSQHDEANATITRMAYFDSVTGLPNHARFEEHLRHELPEAGGQMLALYVMDLNHLREINDALGFHQGDLLLKQVGARIRGALKENVLLARMRGDEFGTLVPVRDQEHAAEVGQQILDALRAPFAISGLNLDVSAAIGISLFPDHSSEPMLLIRYADVAMQQAKRMGQGYVFYAPEQHKDGTRQLSMAAELRRAIEHSELTLFYQPKINMRDNSVCGAEALVRWMHPSRGMIPPDDFIGLAEHTGLIKPLTDWVIGAALRQSVAWRESGMPLPIAVNISARTLHDKELIYLIDQQCAAWRADPEWLEIEITEGAVMFDPEAALAILKRISGMGIPLFIDDFGTGYSSLSYLKKLPVDAVKIDKSFVMDMLTNNDSAAIVRSTVGLAHDLDLKVVAEGIESEAVWQQLAALGCDTAQGYYISKPLPADKFKDWMEQRVQTLNVGARAGSKV